MLNDKEKQEYRSAESPKPPDQRLQELNAICKDCMVQKAKRFETISGKDCMYCPTGIQIHSLDAKSWNKVDWNSAKWEKFYRF